MKSSVAKLNNKKNILLVCRGERVAGENKLYQNFKGSKNKGSDWTEWNYCLGWNV